MKSKKFVWITGLVIVAIAMLGIWYVNKPAPAAGTRTFQVEIIHKDGTRKDYTISSNEEYLGPALLAEDLISGTESQYGLYVDTVDGEQAVYDQDQAWWALEINGESSQTGADSTPLEDGQTYTWIYTPAQ